MFLLIIIIKVQTYLWKNSDQIIQSINTITLALFCSLIKIFCLLVVRGHKLYNRKGTKHNKGSLLRNGQIYLLISLIRKHVIYSQFYLFSYVRPENSLEWSACAVLQHCRCNVSSIMQRHEEPGPQLA